MPSQAEMQRILETLEAAGDSITMDEAHEAVRRYMTNPVADTTFRFLLQDRARLIEGLKIAQETQQNLSTLLEKMTSPPWFPVRLVGLVGSDAPLRAIVLCGSQRRIVEIGDGVDPAVLVPGDEVFLTSEQNAIVDVSPENGLASAGEIAVFDRYAEDGRLILRRHDDEVMVTPSGRLRDQRLKQGDLVRWDTLAWMALERIESSPGRKYFLMETPAAGLSLVGGNEHAIAGLMQALSLTADPTLARIYALGGCQNTILLYGPPGCGKTLMARAVAGEYGRRLGVRVHFAVVKPAEWLSPWVGETERNIRECFAALREAARTGLAVLFLDEVEAVGRTRGSMGSQHSDRFTACLLSEMDGFDRDSAPGEGSLALIAACNRPDLIDPALHQRFSSMQLRVGRPDSRAARAILEIHLPLDTPFSPNGASAPETREQIIETTVSRFYAPNAENELCRIHMRDGSTRMVTARDLVSGRVLEQACRSARMRAYCRHLEHGEPGVRLRDMQESVEDTLERLRTSLTPRNAAMHLEDLPNDIDVVSVEVLRSRVTRAHDYLSIA